MPPPGQVIYRNRVCWPPPWRLLVFEPRVSQGGVLKPKMFEVFKFQGLGDSFCLLQHFFMPFWTRPLIFGHILGNSRMGSQRQRWRRQALGEVTYVEFTVISAVLKMMQFLEFSQHCAQILQAIVRFVKYLKIIICVSTLHLFCDSLCKNLNGGRHIITLLRNLENHFFSLIM